MAGTARPVRVVVGVGGSGRTHALARLVDTARARVVRLAGRVAGDGAADDVASADASCLVVLDDADEAQPALVHAVSAAAARGADVALARRPGVPAPDLARLEEAALQHGGVVTLGPLDREAAVRLLAHAGHRDANVDELIVASGGAAWVLAALAQGTSTLAPAVERRLAGLSPAAVRAAEFLAVAGDLGDEVLWDDVVVAAETAATGGPAPATTSPVHALWLDGLLDPGARAEGRDALAPASAQVLRSTMTGPERRRRVAELVTCLDVAGLPAHALAAGRRAAGDRSHDARVAFLAAGRRLLARDPAAAARWFDEVGDGIGDGDAAAAEGAAARCLAGTTPHPGDNDHPDVAAHAAAADGRITRAVAILVGAAERDRQLSAVPGLVALGRVGEARDLLVAATGTTSSSPRLLAEAVTAGLERPPEDVTGLFVDACEAAAREWGEVAQPRPDTTAAVAAVVLVAAGDSRTALRLLDAADAAGVGGPVAATRHQLMAAWVRLRSGRSEPSTAVPEIAVQGDAVPGTAMPETAVAGDAARARDRLLAAALHAGVARRRGDVVALRSHWDEVDAVLARRATDLFAVEMVEELVVAAVRLGEMQRAHPVMGDLDAAAADVPAAIRCALAWVRLQAAAVEDDASAAAAAADSLRSAAAGPTAGRRQRAQARAADAWARALEGDVDDEAVLAAVADLAAAELPWEAGRLAGQAAVRVADAAVARRLLERARDLSGRFDHAHGPTVEGGSGPGAVLSEREVEVGKLVLAGRTHREIGAQLYISPKTVEHHVARIRTKVGARTRAEFLAALRSGVDDPPVMPAR